MHIAVVVGHPRPQSRTRGAALRIAQELADLEDGTIAEIDLLALGPALLELGSPEVERAVDALRGSDVALVVSPTFKGAYSGLLKLFLDHVPAGALDGTVGLQVMVGGNPQHAFAPELLLRPLLTELGATCPVRGHYLLGDEVDDPTVPEGWLTTVVAVSRALRGTSAATD